MNRFFALVPAALLLSGCATSDMWSEAPGSYRNVPSAPVPWWGHDASSVSQFYGPLSAYGLWVDYPAYGRVFIPNGIGPGWKPYSRGYWANDSYGRRWMSQEPFGWATYHYGRWGYDPNMGWFWVPDTRFSPAWVDWRYADGYTSWAPMAPIGWGNYGYYGNDWWMTAPDYYLWRPGLYQYIRPGLPGNYYPGRPPRPPVVGRPDRPGQPGQPGQPGRPGRPDYPNRPNWPDGSGASRPDRPPPGSYRPGSQVDAPPSNIGTPPREDVVEGSLARGWVPQSGARPEGARPDGVRAAPPWAGQPRRNPAMAPPASAPAYPQPAIRPQMRAAPAPVPQISAPERPHVSQPHTPRPREPAPRTQED